MPGLHVVSPSPCRRRLAAAAVLLFALLSPPSARGVSEVVEAPRPLSAGERAAVGLALDYLAGGPAAWLDDLHPDSPLAALDASAARAEIGVRAGPPADAAWRLQTPGPGQPEGRAIFGIDFPSGATETLVVDLERTADGGWALLRLHCLVDPWTEVPFRLDGDAGQDDGSSDDGSSDDGAEPDDGASGGTAAAPPAAPPGPRLPPRTVVLIAALAAACLVLAGIAPGVAGRRRGVLAARPATVAGLLLLASVGGAALLVACGGDDPPVADDPGAAEAQAEATASTAPMQRLAPLWPLRQAVAQGRDRQQVDALLARVPDRDRLHLAARLWLAELSLNQTDLSEAAAILDELPNPSPLPLGDLLRARLAFVRLHPEDAAAAYDRAVVAGPDHDGIRLEAADALNTLGLSIDAEIGYDLLAEMGSRLAEVYYGKAQYAVLLSKEELGEAYLAQAWHLQPLERGELLSSPLLARLLAHADLFPLFQFSSPSEPVVEPPDDQRQPLTPPPGTRARLTGGLLHLEVASASLEVPGGWSLAPFFSERVTADALRRRDEEKALAALPELVADVQEVGALANPRRRAEVVDTALALARRNRWQDLVRLTDGLDGDSLGPVPGLLVQLRAVALTRLSRSADAQSLLIRLAKSDLANRRRDPASLYQLAELVAEGGDYGVALQLIRKASALSPLAANDQRIRQLKLQERLATSNDAWETERFRIVYPRITGDKYARQLGFVLEEEYQRLRRWIPLPASGGERIEVHLYPLLEFLRAYSGGALVLGVYDGVVRVPLADLRSLHPELVSILSHELAHAMIGRYTDEKAPKWLHEGLAEHVQMTQDWINPVPDLAAAGRVIAFPVVEPILQGFAEPQLIELAYGQSAWTIHYVEARYGVKALHGLLAAFRDGATSEEAVQQVFGMSVADFDADVRRWCVAEAPAVWPTELRRYDHEYDLPFERSRDRNARATRGGAVRPSTPGDGEAGAMQRRMDIWHRSYTRRVSAFKRGLGAVLADVSKGRVREHRMACSTLADQTTLLLNSNDLFLSPDPAAGPPLRRAFERFHDMSESCAVAQGQKALESYRQAERELTDAARALAPYGLAP